VSQIRHTFVVTVFEEGRVAVVEDLHSGAHARVDDLASGGPQIAAWLAERPVASAGADLPRGARGDSQPGH